MGSEQRELRKRPWKMFQNLWNNIVIVMKLFEGSEYSEVLRKSELKNYCFNMLSILAEA
jgi:hypothetical protein